MILTPIAPEVLPDVLDRFAATLADHPLGLTVFRRIADTWPVDPAGVDTPAQRAQAVRLAHAFGLETLDEDPMAAFMWDGRILRTRIEASVIVHEVAHWLCCAPERRGVLDFGLGAGPETGRREEADAALCVDEDLRQWEEVVTSLLGILWEAELGQPAILAFMEQNWLEGPERPSTRAHFLRAVEELLARGLIDGAGRPVGPDQGHCTE